MQKQKNKYYQKHYVITNHLAKLKEIKTGDNLVQEPKVFRYMEAVI